MALYEGTYILNIGKHCGGCPEFDVNVDEETLYFNDFEDGVCNQKIVNRIISCRHSKRCDNLIKYLSNKIEQDKKE